MFEEMNQKPQFIVLIVKEETNRLRFENVRQSGDTFQTADLQSRSQRSKATSSKMRKRTIRVRVVAWARRSKTSEDRQEIVSHWTSSFEMMDVGLDG